jgi:hypothetical protein
VPGGRPAVTASRILDLVSTASLDRLRGATLAILFIAACAIAFEFARPFASGAVGFDSAASVIHFDRIAEGRRLEAFVTATPKPLLTVVYGTLMAVFGDWRAISIATILAFGASISLAAALVWRVGGAVAGPAGALAVAIALLALPSLFADVAIAYAVPWALLLWLVAGLALTAERPRTLLAGLALAGATLARLESLVLVALVVAALPVAELAGRRLKRPLDRRWWWLLVSLVAVPIMLVHDLLLTGNPLFWTAVSSEFSKAAPDAVLTPGELVRLMIRRYEGMPLVVALAVIGFAWLWWRRRVVPLLGLAGLTGGIAAFLVLLAARGTYVSARYLAGCDVGLTILAAFGAVAIVEAAVGWDRLGAGPLRLPNRRAATATLLALALIVLDTWPPPTLNAATRASSDRTRSQAEQADRVLPLLRCALASIPGGVAWPPPRDVLDPIPPDELVLIVPGLLRPRLTRDLGLPLNAVGGAAASALDPAGSFLPTGTIIDHDRSADRPEEAFAILEIDRPTTVAGLTLTPLLADADAGIWVVWIGRAGGLPAPTACAAASSR